MAQKRNKYTLYFFGGLVVILLLNLVMQHWFFRIDLTSDKRYTLSKVSKQTMESLDDIVFIRVYLDGDMPISLKKLKQSLIETLDELSVYANGHLQYQLINPFEGSEEKQQAMYKDLYSKGLMSILVEDSDGKGAVSQRALFPGAILSYGDREKAINFINSNPSMSEDENISAAIQNVEFELVSAIALTARKEKPRIAFIDGHGEFDMYEVGDITLELSQYYAIDRVGLEGNVGELDNYAAVVVARPLETWKEADKLVLDQYLMNGGSVAWFIDEVKVDQDSLAQGNWTFGSIVQHGLDDQLFTYGVRINPNVVQDLYCVQQPIGVSVGGGEMEFKPHPWYYSPLLMPPYDNPITKNLNLIRAQYPSSIDLVGRDSLRKTVLLASSEYSRVLKAPLMISLSQTAEEVTENDFDKSDEPIAVLVEGQLKSVFVNRPLTHYNNGNSFDFKAESKPAKMVVVADADIIRNDVRRRATGTSIEPLGFDRYAKQTFGNKMLVKNIMLYLTNDNELLNIRKKDFTLRLLNKSKVANNRNQLVALNVGLPILLVLVAAVFFIWYRKRKYTK